MSGSADSSFSDLGFTAFYFVFKVLDLHLFRLVYFVKHFATVF